MRTRKNLKSTKINQNHQQFDFHFQSYFVSDNFDKERQEKQIQNPDIRATGMRLLWILSFMDSNFEFQNTNNEEGKEIEQMES